MRHFLSFLTLICLATGMAWADSESLYVYRNDGKFNYFLTDRLDSVVYSNVDMAGKKCSQPVVQEFWVGGKATRIPLTAIDSVRFVSPEENLYLVDPTKYIRSNPQSKVNPNILKDYINTTRLTSLDTTTMMAHVVFDDKVPELYKGAILFIPDGEETYVFRVLESYQSGKEADIHVYPVGPEELVFNTTFLVGDQEFINQQKVKSPAFSLDNQYVGNDDNVVTLGKTWEVNFQKGGLTTDMGYGLSGTVDNFDWTSKLKLGLSFTKPESIFDGIDISNINYAVGEFKTDVQLDYSFDFAPVKKAWDKDWDYPVKVPDLNFKIPIPHTLFYVPVTISTKIKGRVDANLELGSMKAHLPLQAKASFTMGVRYDAQRGVTPYGKGGYELSRQDPTITYDPDFDFSVRVAPLYPEFEITFCHISKYGLGVSILPRLEYFAKSRTWDGQDHLQHKVMAGVGVQGGMYKKELVKGKLQKKFIFETKEYLKGPWKIWSEPEKLVNIDSLKNVYITQNSKTKQEIKMMAGKVDFVSSEQPEPKPTYVPLKNKVRAEIHTKAKAVNPNDEKGQQIMTSPGKADEILDGQRYFEWANEYQEVDPNLSTFKPIFEDYVPAGIETKQLIRICDPETGEVIDSTEIVPINSIKNFDISVVATSAHQRIESNIKVRDFGDYVEEKGTMYNDGEIIPINATYNYGASSGTMILGDFYARHKPSPTSIFIHDGTVHYANMGEVLDQARWAEDKLNVKSDIIYTPDYVYRGVECLDVFDPKGDTSHEYVWHNIYLGYYAPAPPEVPHIMNTESLIIYPDTIPGQPHGEKPIVVIGAGGQSTDFGDGNNPENRVYAGDKPNIPANFYNNDDDDDDDQQDNTLGVAEWTKTWTSGIYEIGEEDRMMIAISTDGWTYFIPNIYDREGDNLEYFSEFGYKYDDYTFKMPCGFKWCDRGSTTYYYVENPATGAGEDKEFKFADRATMCGIMADHGFGDVKMILSYLKPEFMTRVANAGNHQETYDTIIRHYKK